MTEQSSGLQLEMNFNTPSGNRFRRCLEKGVFTVLFEHAAPGSELSDNEAAKRLANLENIALQCREVPAALALTDRSWSDNGRRAVEYAALLPEKNRNSHLIYLSGRNTSPEQMQGLLGLAVANNIENLAAVSGDSRLGENASELRKMPFTESVDTLRLLAQRSMKQQVFAGATVNAHINSAPGLYSSIFKLIKKFNSGAEFAVTQAGFDMAQLDALRKYLSWRGYHQCLIARLMLLTPEKMEKITGNMLPGIRISDDFLNILQRELRFSDSQFEAAQYRRLELQAVGCKLLGYSGIQISGADTPQKMQIALNRISRALKEFTSLNQWIEEYKFYMARSDIAPSERQFYLFEKLLNHTRPESEVPDLTEFKLPEQNIFTRTGDTARRFFFPEADQQPAEERRWLKKLLANCQNCSQCRLPQTQFYCVARCPKQLNNGPCGGVKENGCCEVGNFNCVHWQIWHAAEKRKECDALENNYISPPEK